MLSFTNALGNNFEPLDSEAKRALERQMIIADPRNGTTEIPEDIRSKMAELNKIPYDESYKDTRCHGCDLNAKHGYKACPYQNGTQCQLLVDLSKNLKEVPKNYFRLMPGIHIRVSDETDLQVANSMLSLDRIELLALHDKHLAKAMKVAEIESSAGQNVLLHPKVNDDLAALKNARDAAFQEMNITFKLAYQFALHASSAGYAPSDQELRDEYELSQYYMRKNLGEPVIYQDGRCWYDGYVVSQGYWPGPFPGLEFWRSEKGPLNPEQFSQWLADTESERKQSKLPPVGWKGTPVCGVYAMDILKYYCNIGGVCGPETFKFAILKAAGSMNR